MNQTTASKKHVHIVGICGVGTSAVAIALHKNGFRVTGSDKGFYPPVSTNLTAAGVAYYAGWHPEKMIENGTPDLIVAGGGGTASSNPELIYAKEHNLPIISFAEAVGMFLVKQRSVVCVGTWGKTTSSALLSFIMKESGLDPSYFTGGVSLSHDPAALTNSSWSIFEGDEYQAATWDRKAKFFYYKPTDLLVTSIAWDHADLYPTEQEYIDAYKKLFASLPANGKIVACVDNALLMKTLQETGTKYIGYGISKEAAYQYRDITHTVHGLSFEILHRDETYTLKSPMLGRFNVENITGCFAMAMEIGIPADKIVSAIAAFKGLKRRLERRYEGAVTILDCHAPTPDKARSVLESIREVYTRKIIAVFEPNIGGRQRGTLGGYDGAFGNTDLLVIPRLTKLKVSEDSPEPALEGEELTGVIKKTQPYTVFIDNDEVLIQHLVETASPGDVIAFLGSHGFRNMIEQTAEQLKAEGK